MPILILRRRWQPIYDPFHKDALRNRYFVEAECRSNLKFPRRPYGKEICPHQAEACTPGPFRY
jgi:hypothetical protein